MRKTIRVLASVLLLIGIAGPGFPAKLGTGKQSTSSTQSLASATITLDAQTPRASFAGLDLFLPDGYHGPLPVIIQAHCLRRPDTPALEIDAATFGANAKLLNLTPLPQHNCVSYQVAAQAAPAKGSSAADGSNVAHTDIGVSVHHSAPPQAEGQATEAHTGARLTR